MAKLLWGLAAVFGVLLAALGLLWTLQGAGVVQIEPIACVANCEPIEGFSAIWLLAGIASMIVGLVLSWISARRLTRRARSSGPQA